MARVVAGLAVLALAGAVSAGPALASPSRPGPGYYLSLGDSLAFGYQPNLVAQGDTNPADYRSYAEYYTAITPGLRLVNYGCPGETTTTFLDGGCPWLLPPAKPLHSSYGMAGSQMAAAEAFLTAHRGRVSLVSLDLGNNDLLALLATCEKTAPTDPTACLTAGLPAVIQSVSANITEILATVHRLAPGARVVLFNLYNPLAVQLPISDTLVGYVNGALAGVATRNGAQLADAFGVINIKAGSPVEKASICLLTWECSSYRNIHPTTLGYVALTYALARAAR